ncbi:small ubiquitin-related modifier domain-containing protein [Aspergillus ruber CBS 135680]|uniref:Ubiquitin-like domain-containing protein n=1 Tax=Aspergillus ruber (strain CBS 135680) TaxID=1388766 RepID=A0A017S994_ASPRC|nr:uncharacterized protein EURHEDRAFT_414333 [Aspergillus ruber CBS 135680]EYE93512.1 hypothetical protein EURHEDRAFT_414333 [Aspergillus ruber CBS 135680]
MRSYFRRPSWAKRGIEDSVPDFYRRSEHTYADIIAATKEARERSAIESARDDQRADGKTSKDRQNSNQVGVRGDTPLDKVSGVINDQNSSIRPEPCPPSVLQKEKQASWHQVQRIRPIHESDTVHGHNISASDCGPAADIQSNSQVNDHCNNSSEFAPCMHEEANDFSDDEPDFGKTLRDNNKSEYKATWRDKSLQDDVVVQILITSEIENTEPLIIHRKASQSLKGARLAWCKRQGITGELQSSVYLTWEGRRLFDVTTCKSLGVNVVNSSDGFSDIHYPSVNDGQHIHVEAVTHDFFAFKQKQQQPRTSFTAESQIGPDPPDIGNEERDVLMKIILRCPELDDFGMKVSQKTRVSQIISAFKDTQKIPAEKNLYLLFDGDLLDSNACLIDCDIADQDMVDVLIR